MLSKKQPRTRIIGSCKGIHQIPTVNLANSRTSFLQTPDSRSSLACTRQHLVLLLSHYQVMPSFLDFIFTFTVRETPHTYTSFRHENFLGQHHHQPGLITLGRSGICIQHCFNLLGIEGKGKEWLVRQTAAYHCFDIAQNRILWIIIKGNSLIRERVRKSTGSPQSKHLEATDHVEGSFQETLRTHLLIFEWCVENWPSYVAYLEEELRKFSAKTQYSPVDAMAKDIPANKTLSRLNTMNIASPHPPLSWVSSPTFSRSATFARMASGFSNISRTNRQRNNTELSNLPTQPIIKVKNVKLEDLLSFNELQVLSRLGNELGQALAIIDQNKRIFEEVQEHYENMTSSLTITQYIKDLPAIRSSTSDFLQRMKSLGRDLDNQQCRLRLLLRKQEKIETLVSHNLSFAAISEPY